MGYWIVVVDSLDQLASVLHESHADDLVVAAYLAPAVSRTVAEILRQRGFRGRILVLAEHLDDPDSAPLLQLPQSQCVAGLPSPALDAALVHAANGRHAVEQPSLDRPIFYGMVGRSKAMQAIFSKLEKIAKCDANVCIYGESGTGKELVSRAIHLASARRDEPFITLDCTAVPDGLLESHLFGHVKGAFTGAIDHREGVFSLANKGTLFIDELSELPLPLQAKLLRVVQTREFMKVGGTRSIRTNIRLVTAMNKDPKRAVDAGEFRSDLYYRVAVVMLRMPPLHERKEDIPLLVDHFLRRLSAAYQRPAATIVPEALDRIIRLDWPGNVRELENFIEQAFVLSEDGVLREADLFGERTPELANTRRLPSGAEPHTPRSARVPEPVAGWRLLTGDGPASPTPDPSASIATRQRTTVLPDASDFEPGLPLHEVERRHILRTLEAVHGSRAEAASRLGISIRTLQYRLKAYALDAAAPTKGAQMPSRSLGQDLRMPASSA